MARLWRALAWLILLPLMAAIVDPSTPFVAVAMQTPAYDGVAFAPMGARTSPQGAATTASRRAAPLRKLRAPRAYSQNILGPQLVAHAADLQEFRSILVPQGVRNFFFPKYLPQQTRTAGGIERPPRLLRQA